MGKEVTVHDVFAKATRALQERIAALEPLKSLYNTQNRVIIANTYLIPLLSYLMRFFFMGEDNMSEVERSLARWCVPGRRFTYEHLTAPKQQAGLHQPLRDLFRTSISSVLSNKCATSLPDQQRQVRGFSMLMSEHLTKAAFSFHHLTEAWPCADASQKDFYKMLSSSDETISLPSPTNSILLTLRRKSGKMPPLPSPSKSANEPQPYLRTSQRGFATTLLRLSTMQCQPGPGKVGGGKLPAAPCVEEALKTWLIYTRSALPRVQLP